MQVPAREQQVFFVGPFTVDLASREVWRCGEKIHLQEKPFEILAILLEKPNQLVLREEIQHRLWASDTFVDFEHNINTAVRKLRDALGDSGDHPRYIETVPRRGYRFIASVELPQDDASRPDVPVAAAPHAAKPSWHHTADRSPAWVILLMACVGVLVLGVAVASLWLRHSRNIAASDADPSIAVLPFADLSATHDQEYLSDGLAEEILDHLNRIPNLKVTARTSAFQFKGKNEDTKLIGDKLRVATLLEGSVRREGDRIRITVQLIKSDNGFHLWSDSYDRDLKDVFSVENDIAKAVASALQPKLISGKSSPVQTAVRTTNPEAYEAFLHARYFIYMQDEDSAKKALDHADRAIRFDANYAPAYALRATIELWQGSMAWADLPEAAEKARRDAEKAIGLDPNLADAYRALAMIQSWFELNCRDAEITLKKALKIAPGDPDSLGLGALLAQCQGRLEEARELWREALRLDPLLPVDYQYLAEVLLDLGRYDEAHEALAEALDLNPKLSMSHEIRGEVYLAQGRPQDALAEMEKEPQALYYDLGEALACQALGRPQDSDAALSRLIAKYSNESAYQIAQAYAYRGQLDEAFHWLGRAHAQHDVGLLWFKTDLKFKTLRSDPRYAQMLKLLGLSQ